MSQLTDILSADLAKLRGVIHKLFEHADDVNLQQTKQRIRNEGTGGAGQKNEQNTLRLEELKNDVTGHIDRLLATTETHAALSDGVFGERDESIAPIMPRMRCKVIVYAVNQDKDADGKVTGERYVFTGVGGDKVQHGYPVDGSDEDNDFSKWSPSVSQEIYCTNPALFGTIKVGEKYYVDFTLANGVPVIAKLDGPGITGDAKLEDKDHGSLTTAEPDTPVGSPS